MSGKSFPGTCKYANNNLRYFHVKSRPEKPRYTKWKLAWQTGFAVFILGCWPWHIFCGARVELTRGYMIIANTLTTTVTQKHADNHSVWLFSHPDDVHLVWHPLNVTLLKRSYTLLLKHALNPPLWRCVSLTGAVISSVSCSLTVWLHKLWSTFSMQCFLSCCLVLWLWCNSSSRWSQLWNFF